jgi:serine/threonine protein kinase
VTQEGHSYESDWWALGVIIFEMVTGNIPFGSNSDGTNSSEMDVFSNIMSFKKGQELPYPKDTPTALVDFVSKLLTPIPSERIGAGPAGFQNCKNHEWFKGFDWEALHARKMMSPLSEIAVSYFNECMKAAVMS